MNWRRLPRAILTTALAVGVCSCALNPVKTAGKIAGTVAGEKLAEATANPTTDVKVEPGGGEFCPVMGALGWPPAAGTGPALVRPLDTNPLARPVFGALDHGVAHCGWKAAGPGGPDA